jgi:hypothetical protein
MSTATPDKPIFRPYPDYMGVVQQFQLAMTTDQALDLGEGRRIAAGYMTAFTDHAFPDAERLEVVVVERRGDRDEDTGATPTYFSYHVQPYGEDGNIVPGLRTGVFNTHASGSDIMRHTQNDGELVRAFLTGAQFDRTEAIRVAPDHVADERFMAVAHAEQTSERMAMNANRLARIARGLLWLGPMNPLRRHLPPAGQ